MPYQSGISELSKKVNIVISSNIISGVPAGGSKSICRGVRKGVRKLQWTTRKSSSMSKMHSIEEFHCLLFLAAGEGLKRSNLPLRNMSHTPYRQCIMKLSWIRNLYRNTSSRIVSLFVILSYHFAPADECGGVDKFSCRLTKACTHFEETLIWREYI